MSATQDLIAAALTLADESDELSIPMHSRMSPHAAALRELCARAMVQPAAPDMAEVERLLLHFEKRAPWLRHEQRAALLDYVRQGFAAAPQTVSAPDIVVRPGLEGWKGATIAWEVCASIHREYAKKKDPFFTTRQSDFVKHAEAARAKALTPEPDMAEVERLLEAYDREYASGGSVEDYDRARSALLDYVRGILAERDALIADNTWYQNEFCGRTRMGEPDLTAVYSTSIGGDL